jgi:hypothetical protein
VHVLLGIGTRDLSMIDAERVWKAPGTPYSFMRNNLHRLEGNAVNAGQRAMRDSAISGTSCIETGGFTQAYEVTGN